MGTMERTIEALRLHRDHTADVGSIPAPRLAPVARGATRALVRGREAC